MNSIMMDITFIVKKLLGTLLMPLPFSLILLLLGLIFLWFSHEQSKKQFLGKLFVSLGAAILLVASLPASSLLLNTSLERANPPLRIAPIDLEYVIVLGGGHRSDPYLPPHLQLSISSHYRVMEGIRLMRANPDATLLLSGYGGSDPVSNARLASMVAKEFGIPEAKIKLIERAKDTAEEAALIAPIIDQHKSALVTSASHMPRSLQWFHALGVEPVPSPTYFLGKEPQSRPFFYEQLPGAGNLHKVTVAWHEIVGSAWQKIRQ
jgi:uncharacterized SAM-binding protein YcdF (DUF218 family)